MSRGKSYNRLRSAGIRTAMAVCLLLSAPAVLGQCFSTYLDVGRPEQALHIRSTPDGGSIVVGGARDAGSPNYYNILHKLDATGSVQNVHVIKNDSLSYGNGFYNSFKYLKQTHSYVWSFNATRNDSSFSVMGEFDESGNVIRIKEIPNSGSESHLNFEYQPEGHFMTTGGYVDSSSGRLRIFSELLDSDWNIIRRKVYPSFADDVAYGIASTPDGGYVMAGWTTFNGGIASKTDMLIIKCDSTGAEQWRRQKGGNMDVNEWASVKGSYDGNLFIYGLLWDTVGGIWGLYSYLGKWTPDGDVLWEKSFVVPNFPGGGGYASDLIELPDGEIVVTGTLATYIHDGWIHGFGPDGDSLWSRSYAAESDSTFPDYLFAIDTAWGAPGFWLAGSGRPPDTLRQDVWVLRVDERGDLPCPEDTVTPPPPDSVFEVTVFPNPFGGQVTVAAITGQPFPAGTAFHLLDMTGRLVMQELLIFSSEQYTLATEPLAQGMYLMEVRLPDGGGAFFKVLKE